MVFACEAAVVVKGRDGRTVLLQSRGLDVQQASRAAAEAMTALQAAAQGSEPFDILSSSQSPPLLCGRLDGMHSKFSVTYRVAGALVFMLVTPPTANVFAAVSLLGQVARVTMAPLDGKAVEMTPDRIQRRFGEIYLAVDALLGSGGVLEANAALGRAISTLEQLHEKDRDRGKAGPEPPKTPPQKAGPGRTKRTLQGAIDQLALLSFSTGGAMQNVPPRPGFQLPDAAAAAARGPPAAGPHDPFAPVQGPGVLSPQGTATSASADMFGDDDIFNLGGGGAAKKSETVKSSKPAAGAAAGGLDLLDPFAASDTAPAAWTAFDAAAATAKKEGEAEAGKKKADGMGFEDDAFAGASFAAPPPPLVPSEPVLRLAEVWRGEAAGGRLVRAGLSGRVEWVSEGAKAKVHTVQFLVQAPEPANEHLAAALTTARRHPACCRPAPGVLLADGIQAKPHPGAPLLTYHLPPVACRPPLQAQIGSSWQPLPDGRRLVTLGLHYAVAPRLAQHAAGLGVEVTVPALLEHPLRTSPAGAVFDAKTRVLRWQQQGSVRVADNTGAAVEPCVAVFVVGEAVANEAALTAALARLSASLALRGADGTGSMSGASLAQGVVELELTSGLCGWRAQLTATA